MTDLMFMTLAAETLPAGFELAAGDGDEIGNLIDALLRVPRSDADRVGEPLLVRGEVWAHDVPEDERWILRVVGARSGRHHGEVMLVIPAAEDSDHMIAEMAEALQMALNASADAPISGQRHRVGQMPRRPVELPAL